MCVPLRIFSCPTTCGAPRSGIRSKPHSRQTLQLQQPWIPNPLCRARDQTYVPALPGHHWSQCVTVGIPFLCVPFLLESLAQKVKNTAMTLKDLMHNRSCHLLIFWVSLFTVKKHLISRSIWCQMKGLHPQNQSRRWALKLWNIDCSSEEHQLWPDGSAFPGIPGMRYTPEHRLTRFCLWVTQKKKL